MANETKAPEGGNVAEAQRRLRQPALQPKARAPMAKLLLGLAAAGPALACYQSMDETVCASVDMSQACTSRDGTTTCRGVAEGDSFRRDGKLFIVESITRREYAGLGGSYDVLQLKAVDEITCEPLGTKEVGVGRLAATMELQGGSTYRVWASASEGGITLSIAGAGGSEIIHLER